MIAEPDLLEFVVHALQFRKIVSGAGDLQLSALRIVGPDPFRRADPADIVD